MFSSRDSLRADASLSQDVVLRADFECIMSFGSGLFRVWVSMFLFFCLHWNRRKYRQTVNWGVKSVRLNNTSGRNSHTKHRHKHGTEAGIEPSPLWSKDATLYLPQPSLHVRVSTSDTCHAAQVHFDIFTTRWQKKTKDSFMLQFKSGSNLTSSLWRTKSCWGLHRPSPQIWENLQLHQPVQVLDLFR